MSKPTLGGRNEGKSDPDYIIVYLIIRRGAPEILIYKRMSRKDLRHGIPL
jgi:hypothetical protein